MSLVDIVKPKFFNMGVSKKYSSCPLKKRPVQICVKEEACKDEAMCLDNEKDLSDTSEPENLSIKPEDLSVSAVKVSSLPSPPPNLIPLARRLMERYDEPTPEPMKERLTAFSAPQRDSAKGGVLEPLNLNTPVEHPIAYRPTPQYPPQYMPYSYPFHRELYQPQYHPNTLYHARIQMYPRDTNSPPEVFSPPVRPVPSMPHQGFLPYPGGLSPSSSTSQSPPPISPEDLSSPGSVGSSESSGIGSMGRRRKDSAPRYQCPHCNKSYSTFSGLSKHQQFHCAANEASQAKKSFSCKYCDKVYVSLGALKMHIRTHTLPCKCTVCGKAFSRPWLLQGHVRTHTGEKPFSCQHCGRAFADRSNLRAHLQTHSDVKKYSCPTCAKTFSRMSLLTKHADGGCPGGLSPQDLINFQQHHNMQIPVSPV